MQIKAVQTPLEKVEPGGQAIHLVGPA